MITQESLDEWIKNLPNQYSEEPTHFVSPEYFDEIIAKNQPA